MNYNNLSQQTNWIASSPAFKNIPFFLASVNIPGLNLSHPELGGRASGIIKAPADTVKFNALSFEMLIDEDFLIYQELMQLIKNNVNIETGTFGTFTFNFYIEINNNKSNKVMKLDFYNCRIENLSDIMLDTRSDVTETVLSVDIVYDYYIIEPTIRYQLYVPPVVTSIVNLQKENISDYGQSFNDSFNLLGSDWQLWGFPQPTIVSEFQSTNGYAFYTNGKNTVSGAVLNGLEINSLKNFEFTFKVKQSIATDTYVDFGITEGLGIVSTTNGRTGSTIAGVILDGSGSETYYTDSDNVVLEHNGEYSEYKFVYIVGDLNCNVLIYKDSIEMLNVIMPLSLHDTLYLYVQGKVNSINGANNYLDYIKGYCN